MGIKLIKHGIATNGFSKAEKNDNENNILLYIDPAELISPDLYLIKIRVDLCRIIGDTKLTVGSAARFHVTGIPHMEHMDLKNENTVGLVSHLCKTVADHTRVYYQTIALNCDREEFKNTIIEKFFLSQELREIVRLQLACGGVN